MIHYVTALNNVANNRIWLGSHCQRQSYRQTWNLGGNGQGRYWLQLLTKGCNPHGLHVLRTSDFKSTVTPAIMK